MPQRRVPINPLAQCAVDAAVAAGREGPGAVSLVETGAVPSSAVECFLGKVAKARTTATIMTAAAMTQKTELPRRAFEPPWVVLPVEVSSS